MISDPVLTHAAAKVELDRVFDAPPAVVFEAWSRPEYWQRWFPPRDFTMAIEHMDFRVGGTFSASFTGMGHTHAFSGTYVEIVPGERLAWTAQFPGEPHAQMHTTVTFTPEGTKTAVKVIQRFSEVTPTTAPSIEGAPIGWGQTLDKLGEFLAAQAG